MLIKTSDIILVMFASYNTVLLIEKLREHKLSNWLLHFPMIIFKQYYFLLDNNIFLDYNNPRTRYIIILSRSTYQDQAVDQW